MRKIIVTNIERCLACKGCEIACAVEHSQSKQVEDAIKEQPRPQKRVSVEAADGFAVPIQCQHCEDAPCVEICPTGALHRDKVESPVLVEQELCIGCKFCVTVCPFGVIVPSKDGRVMIKCDLCIERLEAGQEPACVTACPTLARELTEVDEYAKAKRADAARRSVKEKTSQGESE